MMNIRGIIPLTNTTKIQQISDIESLNNTKIIGLTETHTNSNIKDAELQIHDFNFIRCDREGRSHGGVILYLSKELKYKQLLNYSNGQCEVVSVSVKSIGATISVIYRPPDSSCEIFNDIITKVNEVIENSNENDPYINENIIMGDFNFPNNDWKNNSYPTNNSKEAKQTKMLLDVTDGKFMSNRIHEPTRGPNILDLCFISNEDMLGKCEISHNDKLSDHAMVLLELMTINDNIEPDKIINHYMTNLIQYDIDDASDSQWNDFNEILEDCDYELLRSMDLDAQVDYLYKALEMAANKCFNIKSKFKVKSSDDKKVRYIPKEVRNLLRKRIKLNRRLLSNSNWWKNLKTQEELEEVNERLDELYIERNRATENKAISKMNSDPKYFFKFQKRFSKKKDDIGDLTVKIDGKDITVTDDKEKANILSNQYK